MASSHPNSKDLLENFMCYRIVIIDGVVGTLIERYKPGEMAHQRGAMR